MPASFNPQTGVLTFTVGEDDTDAGVHLQIAGEAYPRVSLTQDSIRTGDGSAAPSANAGGSRLALKHAGVKDATTGSFDFDTDVLATLTVGDDVYVDNSAEWIAAWEWEAVAVRTAGVYRIFGFSISDDATGFNLAIVDSTGTTLPSFDGTKLLRPAYAGTSSGVSGEVTAYLPAGTHIEMGAIAGASGVQFSLLVERVA